MNEEFEIGGVRVAPGERRTIHLPVARLYTDVPMTVPVRVVRGRREGPVLFVSAAVHGDEINGVEIVRRVLAQRSLRHLRGTIIAVPVVNVFGFISRSRYLPDRRDLNRSFPGSERGSLAARLANLFLEEIVARSDYGIDLHTGAVWRTNLPQIRVSLKKERSYELARVFGAPLILDSKERDGSLREFCEERGVPVLLYEGGEALRFGEMAIRTGVRGIIRVMEYLEMIRPRKNRRDIEPVVAVESSWVRAPGSGVLRDGPHLGHRVHKGQAVAVISDPTGEDDEPVVAPFDGLVIGAVTSPLVNEGDALYHIAVLDRPKKDFARVADIMPDFDGPSDPGQVMPEAPPPTPPVTPTQDPDGGSSPAND